MPLLTQSLEVNQQPFSCQANVLTTTLWRQGMSHHIAVNHNNKATMWFLRCSLKTKSTGPHREPLWGRSWTLHVQNRADLTESGSTHIHRLCRVVRLGEFLTFQLTLEWNSLTYHYWANSTDETDLFGRKTLNSFSLNSFLIIFLILIITFIIIFTKYKMSLQPSSLYD